MHSRTVHACARVGSAADPGAPMRGQLTRTMLEVLCAHPIALHIRNPIIADSAQGDRSERRTLSSVHTVRAQPSKLLHYRKRNPHNDLRQLSLFSGRLSRLGSHAHDRPLSLPRDQCQGREECCACERRPQSRCHSRQSAMRLKLPTKICNNQQGHLEIIDPMEGEYGL